MPSAAAAGIVLGGVQLFDGDMNTYLSLSAGPARIHLQIKNPQLVNTLRLGLYNVDLYPEDLQIEIRAEGEKDFERIPFLREASRRYIYYHFDPVWAEEVRISATRFSQQN